MSVVMRLNKARASNGFWSTRPSGSQVGRCHVRTLLRRMGIEALYRRPPDAEAGASLRDDARQRVPRVEPEDLAAVVEQENDEVYLQAYDSAGAAREGIGRHLDLYNRRRPHSGLDGMKPDQAYFGHDSLPPFVDAGEG